MAALSNAAKTAAARRSRPLRVALMAALAAAMFHVTCTAFSAPSGMSRSQAKSQLRTRGNLKPQVLEVPLEEPEEEAPAAEPLADYRPPYTLHMVTQFPNHKHLSEEKQAYKYLEGKLTSCLENVDDLIKHVELKLSVEENFHKEKDGHKKVVEAPVKAIQTDDGEIVEANSDSFGKTGAKVLAPYQVKVVVSLKSGKDVIYSNPEKHAESSLTEATDAMADGLRRLLREEKSKAISGRRHKGSLKSLLMGEDDFDGGEVPVVDTIGEAEDAQMEAIYSAIESTPEN